MRLVDVTQLVILAMLIAVYHKLRRIESKLECKPPQEELAAKIEMTLDEDTK